MIRYFQRQFLEIIEVYWQLVRIIVPVTIVTEVLVRLGIIEAIAPVFAPVMALYGLPADLGLPLLTGMLVGLWAAVPVVFAVLSPASLSIADVTVFSALLLFAHALPVEQTIVRKSGPRLFPATLLRIAGGAVFALLLHLLLSATGWLSAPLDPPWIPMFGGGGWFDFFIGLAETLGTIFVILAGLILLIDLMKRCGLMAWIMKLFAPVLQIAGIGKEAREFTAVGLFLGLSFGGGLLIREARRGEVPPRQIFIACVFMMFCHSVIEDTLIVLAIGADWVSVLIGRILFSITASAGIALLLARVPDRVFFGWLYDKGSGGNVPGPAASRPVQPQPDLERVVASRSKNSA